MTFIIYVSEVTFTMKNIHVLCYKLSFFSLMWIKKFKFQVGHMSQSCHDSLDLNTCMLNDKGCPI